MGFSSHQYLPNSSRVEECNRLIDELRAKLERKAYEGLSCISTCVSTRPIHSFDNLLKDFPDTDNAEEIRYMIIRAITCWRKTASWISRWSATARRGSCPKSF